MQLELAPQRQPRHREVRIAVSGEQRSLKKHHGRVPHCRRAAEKREQQLCKHRLDDEE
jgi:hypothetical protein